MAEISVEAAGPEMYRVTVREGGSSTSHQVTCTEAHRQRFGGNVGAASLVEASFRFLLEREPKESILRRFELPVIARYFPEYPDRIKDHLG